jgi:hypothetical protein
MKLRYCDHVISQSNPSPFPSDIEGGGGCGFFIHLSFTPHRRKTAKMTRRIVEPFELDIMKKRNTIEDPYGKCFVAGHIPDGQNQNFIKRIAHRDRNRLFSV